MPKTIHKKFKRSKKPPTKRLVIQPWDIEVFKSLADYRFLDSSQIGALHSRSGGLRSLQLRLQLLFHHGFIDRPPSQLSYYRTRSRMIYAIGNKGADAIYEGKPELRGRIDWQQKNHEVRFPFLDHALMLSDFRVALALALKNHPTAALTSWQQGQGLKDYVSIAGRKTAIAPDALFTLEESNDLLHYFLEVDRSTMTNERFLNKMLAYWRWRAEQKHIKRFNIKHFRVLTTTISEERKENLRCITKQADSAKQGSELYLFTCEKNYSFFKPSSILKPIWQSPKNDFLHHLLE